MTFAELIELCVRGKRNYCVAGTARAGVVAVLDLEGRFFTVLNDRVCHRVNPAAFLGHSSRGEYLNPGGDGLWPAPEGTTLGYEYSTGAWAVPPSVAHACYRVEEAAPDRMIIRADVDLVNNRGEGIPVEFARTIAVTPGTRELTVRVIEEIVYRGTKPRPRAEILLAPWTLSQFDSGPGCEVVFPGKPATDIADFYTPSGSCRRFDGSLWHTRTEGGIKYQIGLDRQVDWIEYRVPDGLTVRRAAQALPAGYRYIDIADRSPDQSPTDLGVRYSVYSDPSSFMEIEAAGGCPPVLSPGSVLSLDVVTTCFFG